MEFFDLGLTDLFSSVVNTGLGMYQQKREQDYNSKEAQKNRDFQLEMWNLNNNYNSPVEQLKRAQAAGINPNALFSNGYQSAVSSAPQGSQAAPTPSIASAMLTQDAVLKKLMADTENVQADTDNKRYELTWNKMTESERYDSLVNMNDEQKAKIAKLFSDIGMNDFNKEMQEKTFRWFAAKSEAEINEMKEKVNLLRNQNIEVIEQINNIKKQGKLIDAQTDSTIAGTKLTEAQTNKTNVDTQGQEYQNEITRIEAEFSQITGIPKGTPEHEAMFALAVKGDFDKLNDYMRQMSITDDLKNPANSLWGIAGKVGKKLDAGRAAVGNKIRSLFTSSKQGSIRNPTQSDK